ncbi:hypothetical protein ACLKA6_019165 [Drosophila palustris]
MCASQLVLIGLCFLLSSCCLSVTADEHNHKYNDGEEVMLWKTIVAPYRYKQKTYMYYLLTLCSGYREPRNATFVGVEHKQSEYEVEFKADVERTITCMTAPTDQIVTAFTHAVMNDYWYQMYIDGLPFWGKIGERDENDGKYYIYTHKKCDIGYNGQQIVDITLSTEKREELKEGASYAFSYEVNWKSSEINFENRFVKYLDRNFLNKELFDTNFFTKWNWVFEHMHL